MGKFKLNGEDIEAIRYTGANVSDVLAFCGGLSNLLEESDLTLTVIGLGDRPQPLRVGEWLVRAASPYRNAPSTYWTVPDDRFRRTFIPIEEGANYD